MSHASLGASGMHRWGNCPGVLNLVRSTPKDRQRQGSSTYALEGSAAHVLCERALLGGKDAHDYLGQQILLDDKGKEVYPVEGEEIIVHAFEVDDEMAAAVQVFLDAVRGDVRDNGIDPAVMVVEQTYDLGAVTKRDDTWGTADVVLPEPFGVLRVYDYKHGRGVVVEVEDNDQAKYYGLGALIEYGADFEVVELIICQPRAFHEDGPVRRWQIPVRELLEWGGVLKAKADRTDDPDAPLVPGDWCRFCPVEGSCPALREKVQEEAALAFDAPIAMPKDLQPVMPDAGDPAAIGRAMAVIPILDSWARAVEGLCQRALESGHEVPGQKLVRKRALRRWDDPGAVERRLRRRKGVKVDDFLEPRKLRSPAQLEKVKAIGKKWVEKHAVKPEGGLTVAPESDPRTAVKVPRLEFPQEPLKIPAAASDGEGTTGGMPWED